MNRFSSECQSNKRKSSQRKTHGIRHSNEKHDTLFVSKISFDDQSHWVERISIDNHAVPFKLDTGSEVNILPNSDFKCSQNRQLCKSKVKLVSYSKHKIIPIGEITLQIKDIDILFQVVDDVDPILGRDTCFKLGLEKRIQSMDRTERTQRYNYGI